MDTRELNAHREGIKKLYRDLLKREADDAGLENYLKSGLSLIEIEAALLDSLEYANIQRKNNFKEELESLGGGELLLMGSSPSDEKNVESLLDLGVQAVLNLETSLHYDNSRIKHFLHVPIQRDFPLLNEQVDKCLSFLYENIVICGRKTFVHSEFGLDRAPTIIALFLMADRGMSFAQAMRVVVYRQAKVNPSRVLVTSSVLEYVQSIRGSLGYHNSVEPQNTPNKSGIADACKAPVIMPISDSIVLGSSLSLEILSELTKMKVKTIFNISIKNEVSDIREAQKFGHVHFPVFPKDLNTTMPAIIRSLRKYMGLGKVYLYAQDIGLGVLILENYLANVEENDVIGPVDIDMLRRKMFAPAQS